MADEKQSGQQKKPGGLSVKTAAIVLIMLVAEGAAIVALMMVLGGPSEVAAVGVEDDPLADLQRLVEVPVLHEKFTNSRQGRVWIWDTEVIVRVKALHSEDVAAEIEAKRALIRTGVSRIMSAAQHTYFNEPGRETLTRQIRDFLNSDGVVSLDAEGEPRVEEVLIPSCIGFPADY